MLKEILLSEEQYIKKYREENKGKFIIRWSSLILILITVMYTVCTFRLPLGFGYIVNVILAIITLFWVYKDLGGDYFVERTYIEDRTLPEKDTTRKDNLLVGIRNNKDSTGTTDSSDAVHDTIKSEECDNDRINNDISTNWGTSVSGNLLGEDTRNEIDEL